MSSIGLPLSLCVQLQVSCLKLDEALWTARSTPDGFSVSLFWPAPAPEKCDGSKRKKRRKRRRAKASQVTLSSSSKSNQAATSSVLLNNTSSATAANQSVSSKPISSDPDLPSKPTPLKSESTATTPAQLQQTPVSKEKSPPAVVDLTKCAQVEYEVRDGEHGVLFRQAESSEAGWTPVVAKRRKKIPVPQYVRHRFPPDHPIHAVSDPDTDTDSGSDCDLDEMIPSEAASIHYKEIDGTPGLSLWTHKTRSWTPVAARTRSKLKNDNF